MKSDFSKSYRSWRTLKAIERTLAFTLSEVGNWVVGGGVSGEQGRDVICFNRITLTATMGASCLRLCRQKVNDVTAIGIQDHLISEPGLTH